MPAATSTFLERIVLPRRVLVNGGRIRSPMIGKTTAIFAYTKGSRASSETLDTFHLSCGVPLTTLTTAVAPNARRMGRPNLEMRTRIQPSCDLTQSAPMPGWYARISRAWPLRTTRGSVPRPPAKTLVLLPPPTRPSATRRTVRNKSQLETNHGRLQDHADILQSQMFRQDAGRHRRNATRPLD